MEQLPLPIRRNLAPRLGPRTYFLKKVQNATAVIWKMLLVAQQRFQRLHASELLTEVYHGAAFVNGVRVMERAWEDAA